MQHPKVKFLDVSSRSRNKKYWLKIESDDCYCFLINGQTIVVDDDSL